MVSNVTCSPLDVQTGELVLRIRGSSRDGEIVRLRSTKCTVGSGGRCTLRLEARGVRPLHCAIFRGPNATAIRRWDPDTRLNGRAFTDSPMHVGDRLHVGPLEFEVLATGQRGETAFEEEWDFPPQKEHEIVPQSADQDQQAEARRAELEAERNTLRQERETWEAQRAEDEKQFQEQEARLHEQTEEFATKQAELEAKLKVLDEEREQWESERESAVSQSTERDQQADARKAELEAERNTLQEERETWEAKQAEAQKQFQEQEARLREQAEEFAAKQADLDAQNKALEEEREQWESERESAVSQSTERDQQAEARRAELEAERNTLRQERETWEAQRAEDEKQFQEQEARLHEQAEEFASRQEELEDHRRALEAERETLEAQLKHWEEERSRWQREQQEANVPEASPEPEKAAPASVGAVLEKLGTAPLLPDEEEETLSWPASPPPSSTPGHGSTETVSDRPSRDTPEGEESIDDYMARLLNRVRGLAEEPSAPENAATEPRFPSTTENEPSEPAKPVPSQSPAQQNRPPVKLFPRAVAPERFADFTAMRELANSSAQSAIHQHAQRMLMHVIWSKLAVMLVALAVGGILVGLWWYVGANDLIFYAGLASFLVALFWSIQYALLTGRMIVNKSGHLDRAVEAPVPSHAEEPIAPTVLAETDHADPESPVSAKEEAADVG